MYIQKHQFYGALVAIVPTPVRTEKAQYRNKMWLIILQDEQGAVLCTPFLVDFIFTVK